MERQLYHPGKRIDCSQFEFDCPSGELNKRSSPASLSAFCSLGKLLFYVPHKPSI